MGSTEDGMKFFFSSLVDDVISDVDHSRVCTAKNVHEFLISVNFLPFQ